MDQYNQETPEDIKRVEPDRAKSAEDRVKRLEAMFYEQSKELMSLRRELLRVKNDVADISRVLNRG
jgi:archaellum component FlaC